MLLLLMSLSNAFALSSEPDYEMGTDDDNTPDCAMDFCEAENNVEWLACQKRAFDAAIDTWMTCNASWTPGRCGTSILGCNVQETDSSCSVTCYTDNSLHNTYSDIWNEICDYVPHLCGF